MDTNAVQQLGAERLRLLVVIASTRPGRIGLPMGQRFRERAEEHGAFAVEVVGLAAIASPLMDEPNQPMNSRACGETDRPARSLRSRARAVPENGSGRGTGHA